MTRLTEIMFPVGKEIKKPKDYNPNDIPAFEGSAWKVEEDLGKEKIWKRIS